MLKFNTLYGKLIKYTLLLLLMPPTIFFVVFYYVYRAEVIAGEYSDMTDVITNQQIAITGWLNHHENLIKFVASSPNIVHQPEMLSALFQSFLSTHDDFKSIVFFDKNGNVKVGVPPLATANVADREYFIRARNGQMTITSPMISRLSGEYIFIVAQPVYNKEHDFEGAMVGAFNFKTLLEEFSLSETNNSTNPYLIDLQSGAYLSDMSKGSPSTIIPPLKTSVPQSYINSNGVRVLGVSVTVNEGKWSLAIERPFNSIMSRTESFLVSFFCVSIIAIAIILPLIKKYISATVKPIEAISTVSTEILNDMSNAECPYVNMKNAANEVVVLYHNFCNMATRMSSYVRELELSTLTDPLTGLANRRSLERDGCRLIEICRRSNVSCTCLVLDIDHFKKVNDTFGHQAGDVALQIVSSILQKHVRSSDICARFGGEEFTILASSTTAEAAMFLAEKIRREVETTSITCDSVTFKITVSIGVAELSQESHACSTALKDGIRAADCAMYTAKKSGRNRSVKWSGEECITA